jgi:two-component system, NarL family, response regulator DevR
MTATSTRPISILLVDDSELVRSGLRVLLGRPEYATHLTIVGEASSVATAIAETARLKPDLVLLDLRLPDGSGLEACRQILARATGTRVLILTSVIEDRIIQEALSSGAHGYLLKEINAQGLYQAIIDVAAGRFIIDPAITNHVLNLVRTGGDKKDTGTKINLLSPQERRVLAFVSEGKTNKEIAHAMGLSDKTVKNYLSNIFEKLNLTRRAQAATFYTNNRNSPKSYGPNP